MRALTFSEGNLPAAQAEEFQSASSSVRDISIDLYGIEIDGDQLRSKHISNLKLERTTDNKLRSHPNHENNLTHQSDTEGGTLLARIFEGEIWDTVQSIA